MNKKIIEQINNPNIIYGCLIEAVHITGYTFERACYEFEYLLDNDRWKGVGKGFKDIDEFLKTINLSEFKIAAEKRKKIGKKLADLRATQRAIAGTLGVDHSTITRDLQGGANAPKPETKPAPLLHDSEGIGANAPTTAAAPDAAPAAIMLSGKDTARRAAKSVESKIKKSAKADSDAVSLNIAREEIWKAKNENINSVCDLRICSCRELFASGIKADAVITDPPYPKEFLPVFSELAEGCKAASIPLVAVMCGQTYLPEVIQRLSEQLKYRWTIAYMTPGGQSVQQFPAKVNTFWKPVLLFGESLEWFGDVAKSDPNDNDKRHHHWGQSESGIADLIERLTKPGQLICDPFLGGGVVALMSLVMGRKFIGCDIEPKCIETTKKRILEI